MAPSLFITVPYALLQSNMEWHFPHEAGANILLDTTAFDIAVIVTFARRNKIKYLFSLSSHMLRDIPDETLTKIYTLLTLSDNCGEATQSIPLFNVSESSKRLEDFFKQQGEHAVKIVNTEPGTNSVQNSILFCDRAHIESLLENDLKNYLTRQIEKIIVWHDDAVQTDKTVWRTFATLTKGNTVAAMLFTTVAQNSTAEQYRHQSLLWQQRAALYLSFISLGKRISQDAYYGIKDWYTTEYEVLPLWYKRFGHIIKVFMGKRSLKSLFDDDLKK
jgi:hypothetical protein